MELRWYWRVLRRQSSLIWRTTAIVAVLALLLTVYGFYGSRNKVATTIDFYQPQPQIGGNVLQNDPQQLALANAAQATGKAKFYTEQPIYFKHIAADLKARYNLTLDWKAVQTGLGANITNGTDLELEYISSNANTATQIVNTARDRLLVDFLTDYNATVVQPGVRPNITNYAIKSQIIDPTNTRTQSLSSTLLGWIVKSLLGVVAGIALAFFFEYIDESIHDEQDVRNWMGAPTLGVIPMGKKRVA